MARRKKTAVNAVSWSRLQEAIYFQVEETSDNLIVQACAGSGKCLEKNTLVIMSDGRLKPVQNISVGELVMGPDSTPREVLSTTNGTSQMYKIVPVKGDPWVCNNEHILTLVMSSTNRVFDLSIQDYLDGISHSKFHTKSNYTAAKLFRVPISFQEKEIFVDPYLLGVWLGDGNSNDTIIYLTEREIYDEIVPSMHRHGIDYSQLTGSGSCLKVSMRTKENTNPLRRYLRNNCKVNGDKTIPFEYLTNSEYVRLEVLAGLLDTDGDYSGTYSITTKFPTLRDDILYLCRSLGFAAYSSIKMVKGKEYHRISISGHLERIPVRLPYKKASSRKQIKNVLRTGFSIEDAEVGDYYGFTLTGDGRFVLGDFTVTHNSTTLFEIARRCALKNHSVLILAFSKDIAEYAKSKISIPGVQCKTFHSHGLMMLKNFLGMSDIRFEINNGKVRNAILSIFKKALYRKKWYPGWFLIKLVKKIRQLGIMTYDQEELEEFINGCDGIFSVRAEPRHEEKKWLKENFQDLIKTLMKLDTLPKVSLSSNYEIDFDDMVRLPCIHNMGLRLPVPAQVVLVDESQDMNPYQVHLVNQLHTKNVRTICVGDRLQAIYAFRGAFENSMEIMKETTGATELPLSITYRSRKKIVDFVNNEITGSDIEAFNPGGMVNRIEVNNLTSYILNNDVRMIIGARNKSLIRVWINLAKKKIGSSLKGTDIVDNLRKLRDEFNPRDMDDFVKSLNHTLTSSIVKDEETGNNISTLKNKEVELIRGIMEMKTELNLRTMRDFELILQEMEQDSNRQLHTVHSAKGLEQANIIVLEDWFSSEQTENMRYVAYTRAKDSLALVVDFFKEEQKEEFTTSERYENIDDLNELELVESEQEKVLTYQDDIPF